MMLLSKLPLCLVLPSTCSCMLSTSIQMEWSELPSHGTSTPCTCTHHEAPTTPSFYTVGPSNLGTAVTECMRCAGQEKIVTSIDVDHSGSRLLAGSRDYSLRMFDFNGMKSDMRSFRRLEPSDGHPVHSVSLSPTGQYLPLILPPEPALTCKYDDVLTL